MNEIFTSRDTAGDMRLGRAAAVERAAFRSYVARSAALPSTRYPSDVAQRLYAGDRATLAILNRSPVAPATTSTATALADLSAPGVAFLASLAPRSAAARMMAGGIAVQLDGSAALRFPRRSTGPVAMTWVLEGEPIPVAERALDTVAVGPAGKLALLTVFLRELARRAAAEIVFRTTLREDAARGLDAALFSATNGGDDHPDGLLAGVSPLSAMPGGDATHES